VEETFRRRPALRLSRLWYRGGLEHIPQVSDFLLPQMADVLTEGVCFDTDLVRGMENHQTDHPLFCEGQHGLAAQRRQG